MYFYRSALIIFLIVFLTGAILVKNFKFVGDIPAAFLNFFVSDGKTIETNKHSRIDSQKGIYSTVWTAKSKRINDLMRIADETEINAIVIDVKDNGVFIDNYMKNLIAKLRGKNIYTIARIIVFQDNSQIENHRDWYFKDSSENLWQDSRGWHWMDPENLEVWDYNVNIAKKAVDAGFDELNFDYIRYPAFVKTDDVDLSVSASAGKPVRVIEKNKIINGFSAYLTSELKKYDSEIALSVDLFAYNMLKTDDLGVGQKFAEIYDYFDYVSPMVYPSHYTAGNFGFKNPAEHPYEVVFKTIEKGKSQLWEKSILEIGTTTLAIAGPIYDARLKKLRPWLQDFNIGAVYDSDMIRKEKQAVYDAGLTSGWLLWNPRNVYTEGALDK